MRGCREDRDRLLSDRLKGNGHKPENRKFSLAVWKKKFTMRVGKHWNRGPEELWDI